MRFENVSFLSIEDLEAFHNEALGHGAGTAGIRDRKLLESAVMAPRSGYHVSLAEMASVYAHGIARNHPFLDGNKRVALLSAAVFLAANGRPLGKLDPSKWETIVVDLASGALKREQFMRHLVAELGGDDIVEIDDD